MTRAFGSNNGRPCHFVRLEDDRGHAIPETAYHIVFDDGSERTGILGRGGAALIRHPPEGPFAVDYPDHDDILAK